MELPTKALDSRDKKIQYTIKTKKLSYWLSQQVDDFSWFLRKEATVASKCILKKVNCEARRGETMAIAGPSGAGKTTLLEALAGMIPPSRLSGNVLVNNQPKDPRHFRRVSGFVTQDEILFPLLTVEETLMYSARLSYETRQDNCFTIHQPGFRILELFDQALLLSNGTVLHQGSLHLLEQCLQFAGHSIPRHVNVLEFSIEVTEAMIIDTEESEEEENADVEQDCEDIRRNLQLSNGKENNICYANPQFKEVLILGHRFSNNIYRTKQLFIARTVQAVLAGIVLGTIFMNAASDSMRFKLQTQIGFFAFSLTFLLSSTTEGLPIYLQERRILMRETSRGAYRISSYVISNNMVFLPFLLIVALLALVPNFIMGTSLIAGLIGSFFLFSGYFISKEDIPKYWVFMHYLSLFKYPFECFTLNEYGGEKGQKRCLKIVEGESYLYGEGFLIQQGLKESQKWSNVVVMLSFIIGYRFLSILILSYRSYRTKY
ncbi:hypothetical protein CRYUN_Cryun17cG0057600 [Craigia yunnanensis]